MTVRREARVVSDVDSGSASAALARVGASVSVTRTMLAALVADICGCIRLLPQSREADFCRPLAASESVPGRSRVRWPTHEPFLRVDFELQVAFVRKALDGSHDPGPPSHVVVAEHDSAGAEHTPKEHEIEGQLFLLVRRVSTLEPHVGPRLRLHSILGGTQP